MKAYVLHGISDLKYEEVGMPELKSGWAIIKVKSCGICSSDIPRIYKNGTYHFPTIPGHEFSGIVTDVGNRENKKLIGRSVGVFPLIPCFSCVHCSNKDYEICSDYDYLGSRRDGGLAEYVAVPVWNLIDFEDGQDFDLYAMMEPLSVAYHATQFGSGVKGKIVQIIGSGMIGSAAAMWAKNEGASEVSIIGRRIDKKKDIIEELGEVHFYDKPVQADYVIESVGTSETIEMAIDYTAPKGELILLGNPNSDIVLAKNNYWKILRRELTVYGSWNSKYDGVYLSEWTYVKDQIVKKTINPTVMITHRFAQEEVEQGLKIMRDKTELYMKVMTKWN